MIPVYYSIYVVRQAEAIVLERLGRFSRVLKPGLNCINLLVDSPRYFTWRKVYIDVNKHVRDETITDYRVDLRESLFQFVRMEVYSKDTVALEVNAVMFYRVVDVRRAIYDVQDLAQAVSDTAQSQLKRIFGGMTFAEALQSQSTINSLMRQGVRDTYEKWGLQVERIELQDLRPKASSEIASAMKKQMIAERERRSEFIHAEGNKASMRLKSEGEKIVKANIGIAEQEATRKRSEGEAASKIELARAEKIALDTIAESIEADGCGQTEFMISKRYNELLRGCPKLRNKTVYLPYEVSSISGLISRLPDAYSGSAASGARASVAASAGGLSSSSLHLRPKMSAAPVATGNLPGVPMSAGAYSELD